MKILYPRTLLTAEQFTDECTPDGVITLPKEFFDLVDDSHLDLSSKENYIYKIPFPEDHDKKLANSIKAQYPFQWIEKGDYVITRLDGYSFVETDRVFCQEHFQEALIPTHNGCRNDDQPRINR